MLTSLSLPQHANPHCYYNSRTNVSWGQWLLDGEKARKVSSPLVFEKFQTSIWH